MSDSGPLKSSYELAMERLRAKDREAGVEEQAPLSGDQKKRIAKLRAGAKAKLAELEILRRDSLVEVAEDPEKLRDVEERYRIDRDRVERKLKSDVRKIRGSGP